MKKLTFKQIRFSPEIEVEFNRNKNTDKTGKIFENKYLNWNYSIDLTLFHGLEFKPKSNNKLYFNKKSLEEIQDIFKFLLKEKAFVSKWCGLHIHLDMAHLNAKEILNIIKYFTKHQTKMFKKFTPLANRRRYCLRLPKEIINSTNTIQISSKYLAADAYGDDIKDHYSFLNYSEQYNTLEFRLFNGTLNFKVFKKNLEWLLKQIIIAKRGI